MKSIILAITLSFSISSFANDIKEFNYKLLEEVQRDIKKDPEGKFRKKDIIRGPASVQETPSNAPIMEENRIDKMNIRQIGPNKW